MPKLPKNFFFFSYFFLIFLCTVQLECLLESDMTHVNSQKFFFFMKFFFVVRLEHLLESDNQKKKGQQHIQWP